MSLDVLVLKSTSGEKIQDRWADYDLLIILDCSAIGSGECATEISADCESEVWAPGVGEHLFTRSLVDELGYFCWSISMGSPSLPLFPSLLLLPFFAYVLSVMFSQVFMVWVERSWNRCLSLVELLLNLTLLCWSSWPFLWFMKLWPLSVELNKLRKRRTRDLIIH